MLILKFYLIFICVLKLSVCYQIKYNDNQKLVNFSIFTETDNLFKDSLDNYKVDFIDNSIDLSKYSTNLDILSSNQSFINQSYCGTVDLKNLNFTLTEYNETKKLIEDEFEKCWIKYIKQHSILDELNHERFFRINCLSDLSKILKCKCSNFNVLIEDGIELVNKINSNISRITKIFTTLTNLFKHYFEKELICYGLLKCEKIYLN